MSKPHLVFKACLSLTLLFSLRDALAMPGLPPSPLDTMKPAVRQNASTALVSADCSDLLQAVPASEPAVIETRIQQATVDVLMTMIFEHPTFVWAAKRKLDLKNTLQLHHLAMGYVHRPIRHVGNEDMGNTFYDDDVQPRHRRWKEMATNRSKLMAFHERTQEKLAEAIMNPKQFAEASVAHRENLASLVYDTVRQNWSVLTGLEFRKFSEQNSRYGIQLKTPLYPQEWSGQENAAFIYIKNFKALSNQDLNDFYELVRILTPETPPAPDGKADHLSLQRKDEQYVADEIRKRVIAVLADRLPEILRYRTGVLKVVANLPTVDHRLRESTAVLRKRLVHDLEKLLPPKAAPLLSPASDTELKSQDESPDDEVDENVEVNEPARTESEVEKAIDGLLENYEATLTRLQTSVEEPGVLYAEAMTVIDRMIDLIPERYGLGVRVSDNQVASSALNEPSTFNHRALLHLVTEELEVVDAHIEVLLRLLKMSREVSTAAEARVTAYEQRLEKSDMEPSLQIAKLRRMKLLRASMGQAIATVELLYQEHLIWHNKIVELQAVLREVRYGTLAGTESKELGTLILTKFEELGLSLKAAN